MAQQASQQVSLLSLRRGRRILLTFAYSYYLSREMKNLKKSKLRFVTKATGTPSQRPAVSSLPPLGLVFCSPVDTDSRVFAITEAPSPRIALCERDRGRNRLPSERYGLRLVVADSDL